MSRCVAPLVACMLLASCQSAGQTPAPVPPPAIGQEGTLGPGDVFEVHVYEEKELSGTYSVGQDGAINFPLIGSVQVGGRGQAEVAQAIQAALKDKQILRDPHVSVLVKELKSRQVTVMGAVAKPGRFSLVAGMTVVQAISMAGGFTSLAAADKTILTRQGPEGVQRFQVQVGKITEGRQKDVAIQAGDTIFVPERLF